MPRDDPAWRDNLIESYQGSLRAVGHAIHEARKRYDDSGETDAKADSDKKILGGMARSLAEALYDLRHGRAMQLLREMTRMGVMAMPDSVLDRGRPVVLRGLSSGPISEATMRRLAALTRREREAYLMFHVSRLSKNEIGRLLKIDPHSVRVYLRRAESKVDRSEPETIPPRG